jgi:hypothetical protein
LCPGRIRQCLRARVMPFCLPMARITRDNVQVSTVLFVKVPSIVAIIKGPGVTHEKVPLEGPQTMTFLAWRIGTE